MRISDWSSDVCSSDLHRLAIVQPHPDFGAVAHGRAQLQLCAIAGGGHIVLIQHQVRGRTIIAHTCEAGTELTRLKIGQRFPRPASPPKNAQRSEEHTSELQSLMRISYAVFCLKKKKKNKNY